MKMDPKVQPHTRNVSILPPVKPTGLRLIKPKTKAGGIPSVLETFRQIGREMGFVEGIKALSKANQKGGFDCPGCAWPDPEERSLVEFCENGAKAVAEEGTSARVDPEFLATYSVEELSRLSDFEIGKSGRITQPMFLAADSNHYRPVSWEEAFRIVGTALKALDSPDEAVFYTSGRTSNEAAFMYQLFVRQFGTNNLPDCSNMCHESSGAALGETLGIGKGSVTLQDIYEAELIIVTGQNPGTNHPRMLKALKTCKDNGGTVVSINPLPETGLSRFVDPQSPIEVLKGGTAIADHHLPVRINGDVALLKGVMKLMLEAEEARPGTVFDWDFIREKTEGIEAFLDSLRPFTLKEAVRQSGIPEKDIRLLADLVIRHQKIIVCWAMGLTQHENGVNNIREIVNLLLLRGSIGKPGAGTCPVRGHSNVQGDRTVGIVEKPSAEFLAQLGSRFKFNPPQHHGFDTVEAIKAMQEGRVKVFVGLGGNFISATPDSMLTGKAIQNCNLSVQISTKLNRAHLVTGKEALILPCIARQERDIQNGNQQFMTVENSMGQVHSTQGQRTPASPHLLSEPAIIAGIALASLGNVSSTNWEEMATDYDLIRDHIEACIPGFEDYNRRARLAEGFYLPNGSRTGDFQTRSGKAKFTHNPVPDSLPGEGKYLMMTIRTHDQYNTTIYGLNDRYRGIMGERRVILMNEEDMREAGFTKGDLLDITSHFQGKERSAKDFFAIPYSIPSGCVATYFPEANVLIPLDQVAAVSNTPASKSVVVSLAPAS